jgi:hypothetical protein
MARYRENFHFYEQSPDLYASVVPRGTERSRLLQFITVIILCNINPLNGTSKLKEIGYGVGNSPASLGANDLKYKGMTVLEDNNNKYSEVCTSRPN